MNRKLIFIIPILLLSVKGFSQIQYSIGFKTSLDKQYFIYQDLRGNNYDKFPDFSVGTDVSFYLTDRIRLRSELKYTNVSYTRDWGNNNSLLTNINYSKMQINNLNINPYFDYRLFSLGKALDVYYTFGMKLEFSIGDRQRAFTYEGKKLDNYYILDEHKSALLGSGTGLIFKYNINDNLGITLFPEASIFYGEYYEKNNWHYVRSSVNLGFEWNF